LLSRSIADDDVQAAQSLHSFLDQRPAERLVPEVAGDREANAARLLDECDHFLRVGLFGWEIVDGDIGAFARIGDRSRTAHAGISTGDECLADSEAA